MDNLMTSISDAEMTMVRENFIRLFSINIPRPPSGEERADVGNPQNI